MNKSIVLRMTLILVCVGLMMFSFVPDMPTNAQDKDACKDLGWTPVDGFQVKLNENWTGTANRNCKESAAWQYSFVLSITKDGSTYYGQIGNEEKTKIEINGSKFTWVRDLRKGAGPDDNKNYNQTWTGTIERNENGRVRIYGTWNGAYRYKKGSEYNLDFMLIR